MSPSIPDSHREAFAQDVLDGLGAKPKSLKPKYFYDARGSELFEAITRQPEYYLTRTEAGLLRRYAPSLGELMGKDVSLVELGSGSAAKTAILLERLLETGDDLNRFRRRIGRLVAYEVSPLESSRLLDRLYVPGDGNPAEEP